MPRKANIPDRVEIAALPRWARVAFAARCARRVQPLFRAGHPKAPQTHLKALDTAVMLSERAADAVRRDFEMLQSAAAGEGWRNDTPVPSEFFGPLWPQGVPQSWPEEEETSESCEVVFVIDVPQYASDKDIYDKAVELADRADALHRVYGGRGILSGASAWPKSDVQPSAALPAGLRGDIKRVGWAESSSQDVARVEAAIT